MHEKEVIISNSKLNSYGGRVLTSGISIEQYSRNPILLWMHNRPFRGTNDEVLPIGHIKNLRVDGDNLIGTPVFDDVDDFSKKIKAKWEAGTLKMVSAGIEVIELSDDPIFILPGQRRQTVTKSKLIEVSIVDIGANDDSLVLYQEGKMLQLSATGRCDIPEINKNVNIIETQMKTISLKLGLQENASETDVLNKISELQTSAKKVEEMKKTLELQNTQAIETVVNNAVAEKRITDDKKSHFMTLGKLSGLDVLTQTLSMITPAQKPNSVINHSSSSAQPEAYKKMSEVPEAELKRMRLENKEQYIQLFKAEYGFEPEIK